MCVQGVDVHCVLQFTLIHAAGCALHRRTSRVIHRSKLFRNDVSLSFSPLAAAEKFRTKKNSEEKEEKGSGQDAWRGAARRRRLDDDDDALFKPSRPAEKPELERYPHGRRGDERKTTTGAAPSESRGLFEPVCASPASRTSAVTMGRWDSAIATPPRPAGASTGRHPEKGERCAGWRDGASCARAPRPTGGTGRTGLVVVAFAHALCRSTGTGSADNSR